MWVFFKLGLEKLMFRETLMRRAMVTAVVTMLMTIGAAAQNNVAQHDHSMMAMSPEAQAEHLARLRAELEAGSSHGPVIPQPESVQGLAVQNITMTAKPFDFTPTTFTLTHGALANITVPVPSTPPSTLGPAL